MRSGGRWIVAAGLALFSLIGYWSSRQVNPVTGESQHVRLSPDQEIALGLKAAPEMAAQHGGLSTNREGRALVEQIGGRIVRGSAAGRSPYRFQFHLLDDDRTINAFALPGGQVFLTDGLARKLRTEGEIAGVLGHEVAHVIGRHSAEHLAKAQLLQGLGGAAVIAGADPDHPERSYANQAVAAAVLQLINLKFTRSDELEADRLGVRLMGEAGYDPRGMIRVMEVLGESERGGRRPDFLATHPSPENRIPKIKEAIQQEYPQGLPAGLER